MTYLLDTCVISEPRKEKPDPKVLQFLANLTPLESYLSVVSIGETWKGIELLVPSRKRNDLTHWFHNDLLPSFAGRIILLDQACLMAWGKLVARLESTGFPMPAIDSLIAATALAHDLTVVTRNESDFAHAGVKLLNPWK